jgi:molecular chaperone GrpE (heat shock protein)
MAADGNTHNAVLVSALIDLSDRVPSQALRAEIIAALGRAGVHPLEPAVGDVFDVSRMRGVGGAPAADAGWAGRVASVERAGFHDGVSVLRLPEVVVYTTGS